MMKAVKATAAHQETTMGNTPAQTVTYTQPQHNQLSHDVDQCPHQSWLCATCSAACWGIAQARMLGVCYQQEIVACLHVHLAYALYTTHVKLIRICTNKHL